VFVARLVMIQRIVSKYKRINEPTRLSVPAHTSGPRRDCYSQLFGPQAQDRNGESPAVDILAKEVAYKTKRQSHLSLVYTRVIIVRVRAPGCT
jgi:hypothetical protein